MSGNAELLARVQAIGSPLTAALGTGDGAPVEQEIVKDAVRRLDALAEDIEKGLYAGE